MYAPQGTPQQPSAPLQNLGKSLQQPHMCESIHYLQAQQSAQQGYGIPQQYFSMQQTKPTVQAQRPPGTEAQSTPWFYPQASSQMLMQQTHLAGYCIYPQQQNIPQTQLAFLSQSSTSQTSPQAQVLPANAQNATELYLHSVSQMPMQFSYPVGNHDCLQQQNNPQTLHTGQLQSSASQTSPLQAQMSQEIIAQTAQQFPPVQMPVQWIHSPESHTFFQQQTMLETQPDSTLQLNTNQTSPQVQMPPAQPAQQMPIQETPPAGSHTIPQQQNVSLSQLPFTSPTQGCFPHPLPSTFKCNHDLHHSPCSTSETSLPGSSTTPAMVSPQFQRDSA